MKTYINRSGFTLIEIIAILVILGIITAVAISRISSSQNDLFAATDTLTSHLRLAQARAMNTYVPDAGTGGSVWGVNFTSSTKYNLFYCDTAIGCTPAASKIVFPGAGSLDITPTGGVQVTTNGSGVVAFDRFGTNYDAAADVSDCSKARTAQLTLTLKDSKGNIRTINITPQTGMIK